MSAVRACGSNAAAKRLTGSSSSHRSCRFINHAEGAKLRKRQMIICSNTNGLSPKPDSMASSERVVNISEVLSEARQLSPNLVFQDFDPNEPEWIPPPEEETTPAIPEPSPPSPSTLPPELNPLLTASAYTPEQGFKELTVNEVSDKLAAGELSLVLDVREREEVASGTIAGSLNIPLSELSNAARSGRLDDFRGSPIVVICAAGIRSAQATVRLTKVLGFENVSNMQGGVYAWLDAGLPLHQN